MIARIGRLVRRVGRKLLAKPFPAAVRAQIAADRQGVPDMDIGSEAAIEACMGWLARAQDCSRPQDDGVARVYDLASGWSASYPETTGYIIPTFLTLARDRNRPDWRERARRMLDWLVHIQLPSGAFQGGMVDSVPVVPVAFNTGQILMGLAAGEAEFGTYRNTLCAAADWLVENQDSDGCWRKGASPFVNQGEKAYDTHIAWGLIDAARILPDRGYGEAALANVRWALTHQQSNGWLAKCCLTDPSMPLTHTLGYALRGLLEANQFEPDAVVLRASRNLADGILSALHPDGFLPGRLNADWSPAVSWSCLTGSAQVAHCWLMLHQLTGENRYLDAGRSANRYVRRTLATTGSMNTVGAVRGSFPIDGQYCRFQYPNWAAKFLVDSLVLEQSLG